MKNLSKVSLIIIALLSTSVNARLWDKNKGPKGEVKEVSAGGELAALKARIAELEAGKARSNLYTEVAKDREHLSRLIHKIARDCQFATLS